MSAQPAGGHRSRHLLIKTGFVVATMASVTGIGVSAASAHPLGNFSVNHLNQLSFSSTGVTNNAVIDTAEIPTAQAKSTVDTDGSGEADASELSSYAEQQCAALKDAIDLTVDGALVPFAVTTSSFTYQPGQAGLTTSRLECRLLASTTIAADTTVSFADGFLTDRVGWHEITAIADGVRLIESPVPQDSITNGLTTYPVDLLASPLDVRSATFDVQPGNGPSTVAADARDGLASADTGFFSGLVDNVQRTFDDLIGRRELTLGVGILAVALALVLGASHALLPGHGKTVMAAYIAGRQGSVRDAVIVGATVTGTHTGGVLVLGLALTLSTSLAGEAVLGWLGVTSGVMVAGLGVGLLVAAIRHHGSGPLGHGHTHAYNLGNEHSHSHGGHAHSHGPRHSHGRASHTHNHQPSTIERTATVASALPDRGSLVRGATLSGMSLSRSGPDVGVIDFAQLLTTSIPASTPTATVASVADDHGHGHGDDHDHDHGHDQPHVSRRGLIGMGIAGGLVPSPSALIILLSAIALGRTWFGILLVVGYGAGMAGTLTLAGVLLVKVRDRYQERMRSTSGRVRTAARRWGIIAPYFTAGLVLVVGAGLAIRSLGAI